MGDNLGKWDYSKNEIQDNLYFPEETYKRATAYLDGKGTIADWGCGLAYFKKFIKESKYIGIDGSASKFTDVVADLEDYTKKSDCIFMRHVLEHNYNWKLILRNALKSFKKRMVLVLFAASLEPEHVMFKEAGSQMFSIGIPTIMLNLNDVRKELEKFDYVYEEIKMDNPYSREKIFYITKENK